MYAEHLWCRHISQNRVDGGMSVYVSCNMDNLLFYIVKSITLLEGQ